MKSLPITENPHIIRTDFSNQSIWESICTKFQTPVGPLEIQGIENNLSISNMCFYEIAELVDDDGIFRGIF